MRKLRYLPEGGALVEVTCRTIQGRFLLRPSRIANHVFLGVLARAQRRHPLDIVAVVAMSNHCHLLLRVDNAERLARFMGYFLGQFARKAGRLSRWKHKFWARRYHAIEVSPEAEKQVERLRYLLAHGAKEDLVPRPEHWPGVHCARALSHGEPLRGFWFNATEQYYARRRGQTVHRYTFAEPETLHLAKLPCWAQLSDQDYRNRIDRLLEDIQTEIDERRRIEGVRMRSAKSHARRLRRQNPHHAPDEIQRRPAPDFHAFRSSVRKQMRRTYALFLEAYRAAAEKLKSGNTDVRFPEGGFPPGLPFVHFDEARAP